jgi:hypothetical protein
MCSKVKHCALLLFSALHIKRDNNNGELITELGMPSKKLESLQAYVQPEVKAKLTEWAAEEDRSISWLVAKILTEAVEQYTTNKNK